MKYRRKPLWLSYQWMMIKHLYVHVPFCRSFCAYCDFSRSIYRAKQADDWLKQLANDFAKINVNQEQYETIYIGGGTPSALSNEQLKMLLELIKPFSNSVQEYTVEANPDSLSADKIAILKEYGVNRISLGLQSADPSLLKLMHRTHSFQDVKECIAACKDAGINEISVDLIYSLPTQTMKQLANTLELIDDLKVPHLSLYSLTIEPNSYFGRHGFKNLDADIEADMYEYIEKTLTKRGYIHYEVANFALAGHFAKHNLGYWLYDDFRGIGPGASGKEGNIRYTNDPDLDAYILGERKYAEYLELSKKELMFENIMMSLRTIFGLDLALFKQRYACDALDEYRLAIEKWSDCLRVENNHLICTNLELLNEILIDFMN